MNWEEFIKKEDFKSGDFTLKKDSKSKVTNTFEVGQTKYLVKRINGQDLIFKKI